MEDSKKTTQERATEDPPLDGNFQADVQEDDRATEEDQFNLRQILINSTPGRF